MKNQKIKIKSHKMGEIRKAKFLQIVKKVIENQRKSYKMEKIRKSNFPLGAWNCEKIRKTWVSRFLAFYPLIWAFQTLSRTSNDGVWRDLSFDIKTSWFHALWLGIQPFLCLDPWKSREVGVGMAVCVSARSFMWGEVFGMLNKLAVQHIYSRM